MAQSKLKAKRNDYVVELLRYPTKSDWQRCKALALNTVGKKYYGADVDEKWKRKILFAQHSPIRTLMFTIRMEIPYYVSVHLVRHKYGVEHFVQSQRNDRQSNYDRRDAPQGAFVSHVMDINAQALIQMANMRLCGQADIATQNVMQLIVEVVNICNPEFSDVLVPKCALHGGVCNEFKSCGRNG